jgi:hypothetical protein
MQSCIVNVKSIEFTNNKGWLEADKWEKMPVLLEPVTGSIPSKATVVSGTLAENAGFKPGTIHMITWQEDQPDEEHGRQFTVTQVVELTNMDKLDYIKLWREEAAENPVNVYELDDEPVQQNKADQIPD